MAGCDVVIRRALLAAAALGLGTCGRVAWTWRPADVAELVYRSESSMQPGRQCQASGLRSHRRGRAMWDVAGLC